jgi:hypothetical protein
MNIPRLVPLVISVVLVRSATAEPIIQDGTVARFASVAEGAEILGRKDDFIQRLSAFDRSARMKTAKDVSVDEFLGFVRANVVEWTDAEKKAIETALAVIRQPLEALRLPLPKTIYFIKTTGAEEGMAFYTRDSAIIFPKSELPGDASGLQKTVAHELFHILSRENPDLREKLYQLIGFTKCPEIELPDELKARKITNPDTPRNDHSIHLRVADREVTAIPILFSKNEKYDMSRGGEFFAYLEFQFLLLPQKELIPPKKVAGFFEQVGRNTEYVIHPEEILADNFALLITGGKNLPTPEIQARMRELLSRR